MLSNSSELEVETVRYWRCARCEPGTRPGFTVVSCLAVKSWKCMVARDRPPAPPPIWVIYIPWVPDVLLRRCALAELYTSGRRPSRFNSTVWTATCGTATFVWKPNIGQIPYNEIKVKNPAAPVSRYQGPVIPYLNTHHRKTVAGPQRG